MTLEERIVNELKAERDRVPVATPGPVPTPQSRWPRYLGVVAAVVLVVGLGWVVSRVAQRGDAVAAAVDAGELVIDGGVVVPILGELGSVGSSRGTLAVVAGGPAPGLEVDLDFDGVEQPLVQGSPRWDESSWPGDVPVVYIGSLNGRSVFVHTNGTIGLIERLRASLSGHPLGEHICMTIGDSHSDLGGAGFCGSPGPVSLGGRYHDNRQDGGPVGAWATWIDVPEGTALVTLTVDEESLVWQRPVADTSFFDIGRPPTEPVIMTAVGVDGSKLGSEVVPVEVFR